MQKERRQIIIGSRESKLAVVQSRMVADYLREQYPQWDVQLLTMKTTGDRILDRTLDQIGGKGLFVKELDKALMEKRSDLSVHSLKDMPMEIPPELPLVAFPGVRIPGMCWFCQKAAGKWIRVNPSDVPVCAGSFS